MTSTREGAALAPEKTRSATAAPTSRDLPAKSSRRARGGAPVKELSLQVKIVTPVLGGGTRTRMLDDVDVVRAATVRGHLRFWWRALYAARYERAEELATAETALWGRAATESGGRSAVDLRVAVETRGSIDKTNIELYDSGRGKKTLGAYALWPARAERDGTPVAARREPGTEFRLTLTVSAGHEDEIRNAVRAWLLFGGYGGRTRRGVGSLCASADREAWHPKGATREALTALFGVDVFAPPARPPIDTPWLAGATLYVGNSTTDATPAWTTALDWLALFRQGTGGGQGNRAREPGSGNRPSISNWPEADKIRRFHRKTKDHPPRHNGTPAWPRAGFGLPIVGQFQKKGRDRATTYDEPGPFELRWQPSGAMQRERGTDRLLGDRLASPLIIKALPLAKGFVPCALWLNRAHPNGEVILRDLSPGRANRDVERSGAPFDRLVANGDTPQFFALAGKRSLRDAFLDWLHVTHDTTVVAP